MTRKPKRPPPPPLPVLPTLLVTEIVRTALREDFGRAGDITSMATISERARAKAVIAAREPGTLAGLALAERAFAELDQAVEFKALKSDGDRLAAGAVVCRISGPARAILAAERVALNFLGHLSGIASETARLVECVAHTKARICCTRKTTPGLRAFEKYAVRCGGGWNHRFGLDDAMLIKDNHIAVAGGVGEAILRARSFSGHLVKIEVEVDNLDQLDEAIAAGVDVVLLDNMKPPMLRRAVELVEGRALIEASGGITIDSVAAIAETGVDYISSGWITHSAPSLDLGLDIVIAKSSR